MYILKILRSHVEEGSTLVNMMAIRSLTLRKRLLRALLLI